jgi:hypothetical protein
VILASSRNESLEIASDLILVFLVDTFLNQFDHIFRATLLCGFQKLDPSSGQNTCAMRATVENEANDNDQDGELENNESTL